MLRKQVKFGVTLVLLCISILSIANALYQYQRHEVEITLYLADLFTELALPYRLLELEIQVPEDELRMPILGIDPGEVADTWGEPRGEGREHQGVDIFAPRGTPIFAAAEGYVLRAGEGDLGGNFVFTVGKGGVRYYYAHMDSIAQGIERGASITTDTVLGFVGTTGNATGTPPHLHFGMYHRGPQNPYDLLVARE